MFVGIFFCRASAGCPDDSKCPFLAEGVEELPSRVRKAIAPTKDRIRLHGFDALKIAQNSKRNSEHYKCGEEAKQFLANMIGSNPVY